MGTYKGLMVCKKAFALGMEIHQLAKKFPKEERYSLTDQIRRSSRSVCTDVAEGFRKLRYKAHFIVKIADADMENSETQVGLDFSFAFGYLKEEAHLDYRKSEEAGRMLNHLLENPEKYGAIGSIASLQFSRDANCKLNN